MQMSANLLSRSSIWRVVREHRLFSLILGLAVALRAVVAVTYRPALFFTGDSVVYLGNSANLVPGEARPILYAVFLRVILLFHHLFAVPVLQHLFGLASGILTYVLLRHLGVAKGIAVAGTVFVLFDPLQLVIEQHILSESLFQLMVVAALAVLLWQQRPATVRCAIVGFGLAAATVTRNVGLIVIVPTLGFAVAQRFGWKRVATLTLSFALPLLAYAGWFYLAHGRFGLENYGGRFLYGRVAPFANCHGLKLSAIERTICPTMEPRSPWPTWYVFGPPSPFFDGRLQSNSDANQIARTFALTIIRHQPTTYIRAVSGDFLDYFRPARATGPDADPVAIDFPFRLNQLTAYPSPLIEEWIKRADASPAARAVIVRPLAKALVSWQRFFYLPGPLFALALLAGFLGIVGWPCAVERRCGAEGVLYSSIATLLLIVPVAAVVFDYRHMVPAFPLMGTAGALGASLLLERIRLRRSARPRPSGPSA